MKLSYSKILLAALVPLMGTSLMATERLDASHNNTVVDDHAYEPVQPTDKQEGIDIGNGWIISGDERAGYVNYNYGNSPENPDPNINKGHMDSRGIFFIPKLSLTSPKYNGFYGKITGAAVTDLGINDPLYNSRTFGFGASGDPYAILQEAHLAYDEGDHKFLVGAEELTTPMIDADDWYLLSNSFQLAYYANRSFENILLAGGYFYKMAGPWDSGADGATYNSMAEASFVDGRDKDNAGDSGVITGVFQYSDETHNLQLWEYYATDLYNTFFAQYDYTGKLDTFSYDAGLQFINFKEVGALADNDFTQIDYSIFSLRFDGKFENGFDIATGATFFTDGEGTGATLGAWGGYPYFANGMIFHFFESGTLQNANSYKVQLGYNFSDFGLNDLWAGVRYTYFDLDPVYSTTATGLPQDAMSMVGLKLSYGGKTGFYLTTAYEHVDLDHEPTIYALRIIGGYRF